MGLKKRGQQQIPGQLKMLMTPSEIHAEYQPLDADRYDRESYQPFSGSGSYDPSERTTGGNIKRPHYGYDPQGNYYQRTSYGSKSKSREETDEELFERKRNEAYGEVDDDYGYEPKLVGGKSSRWSGGTAHYHGGATPTGELSTKQKEARQQQRSGEAWGVRQGYQASPARTHPSYYTESSERYHPGEEGVSLGESIEAEGVKSPIRLGRQIGSMGKKQIVGGHHRLAVASALDSEQLLPVIHHTDIQEARSPQTQRAWKYT